MKEIKNEESKNNSKDRDDLLHDELQQNDTKNPKDIEIKLK